MKIIIVLQGDNFTQKIMKQAAADLRGCPEIEVEEFSCEAGGSVQYMDFGKMKTDIIILPDLHGFTQCTLTGGVAYNLVDSKFIHLLLHESLQNESFLGKQLSISMFFYCVGENYYKHLQGNYPDLPYLKELKGWNDGEDEAAAERNAGLVVSAVKEVIEKCHLQ